MDGGIVGKVVVVTESATPLMLYGLEQMSSLEITAGLSSIIEALVFLHDKVSFYSYFLICKRIFFSELLLRKLVLLRKYGLLSV